MALEDIQPKQKETEWRPTRKQAAVLQAAQEAGLNRTITKVCEEAGVPRTRFYKWLNKDPNFKRAWEDVWYGTVRRHLPGAIQALAQRAQSGDVQAIKLMAELAGVYKEKKGVELSTRDGQPLFGVVMLPAVAQEEAEAVVEEAVEYAQGRAEGTE